MRWMKNDIMVGQIFDSWLIDRRGQIVVQPRKEKTSEKSVNGESAWCLLKNAGSCAHARARSSELRGGRYSFCARLRKWKNRKKMMRAIQGLRKMSFWKDGTKPRHILCAFQKRLRRGVENLSCNPEKGGSFVNESQLGIRREALEHWWIVASSGWRVWLRMYG